MMYREYYMDRLKLAADQHAKEKEYWMHRLAGWEEKTWFPYDHKKEETGKTSFQELKIEFNPGITSGLIKLSSGSNHSLHIIFAAGVTGLLTRYTGNHDVIIGTPVYEPKIETEFINTIFALRNQLKTRMTFKELLLDVRQSVLGASENQNFPLEILIEQLGLETTNIGFPLFDVIVWSENLHNPKHIEHIPVNMVFSIKRESHEITGKVTYNSLLYEKQTIERIIGHLINFLQVSLFNLLQPIAEIDFLFNEERNQILYDFNHTGAQYPSNKTIHTIFTEQVEKHPHNTAVILAAGELKLTYRKLNQKANGLAKVLRKLGTASDKILGIILEPSVEMIAAILAILKAGGGYLPIDPAYPQERIKYILNDSNPDLVLSNKQLKGKIEPGRKVIDCDDKSILDETVNLPEINCPDDAAYIIYTSGTTGKPKGAMVDHKNVIRLIFNDKFQFDFKSSDVWTMFHSYNFDFSVWEMYGALLYGGKLIPVPKEIARDPGKFLNLLERENVTVLNQVPTAFYQVAGEALGRGGQEKSSNRADLHLRYIIFGGEALKPVLLKEWQAIYPTTRLINMFGITETTVHVTYKEIGKVEIMQNSGNIGKPLPTTTVFVLDKHLKLLPVGVPGQLCVGGMGVARGYMNRPELTAERFRNNPFDHRGNRLYYSGDLVKMTNDGEMIYIGRIDQQIQLRGFRIEPGEIESRLLRQEAITDAIVLETTDEKGDKCLCTYVVMKNDRQLEPAKLRKCLNEVLPDYMIPNYFISIDKIPLTANGKLDRRGLPEPLKKSAPVFIPPRSNIEKQMAGIWARELGVERVGAGDNYFQLGGDSIKAIRLINAINVQLNTRLHIADLYRHQTLEELAGQLKRQKEKMIDTKNKAREEALAKIKAFKARVLAKNHYYPPSLEIEEIYPMSDIEKGMAFYYTRDFADGIYHNQVVYQQAFKDFEPGRMEQALTLLIQKHPILRTGFLVEESAHIVYKSGKSRVALEYQDISDQEPKEQEHLITRYARQNREKPFNLLESPLWRLVFFKTGPRGIAVFWQYYHGIIDGWSNASFFTELNNTYHRLKQEPAYLPGELKSGYKEFIIEQMVERENTSTLDYWKSELLDYRRWEFPGEYPGTGPGEIKRFTAGPDAGIAEALKSQAKQSETTLKHLCFAAYLYMLNMFSYENDITTGLVTHARPLCEDGDRILGCFLNTVPFRVQVPFGITWRDWVDLVDKKMHRLKRYERLSFIEILNLLEEKTRDRHPVFDTVFNFIDFHIYHNMEHKEEQWELEANLELEAQEKTNYPLCITINAFANHFLYDCEYSTALISEPNVNRLYGYFTAVLTQFIKNIDGVIDKNSLIPREEKKKLLRMFNVDRWQLPLDKTIHRLFEEQEEKTPEHIALIGENPGSETRDPKPKAPSGQINAPGRVISITYRELNKTSDHLAHVLKERGVKPGDIVGIMLERSLAMIAGILGILKAGGAYLPIEPGCPGKRVKYMLNDSSVIFLITKSNFFGIFGQEKEKEKTFQKIEIINCQLGIVNCQREAGSTSVSSVPSMAKKNHLCQSPATAVSSLTLTSTSTSTCQVSPTNLAYIIYTSGSTGNPKGVMVGHGSVVNLLNALQNRFPLREKDAYLFKTSYQFDVSVSELFGWYLAGGRLVILAPGGEKSPGAILEKVVREGVTHINFVPSMFGVFLEVLESHGIARLHGMKYIFLAGEALPAVLVKRFRRINTTTVMANLYGPTEAAVYAAWYPLAGKTGQGPIPIGKPLPNVCLYIVDKRGYGQPIAVPGELFISGSGIARGYLNQPGLTFERFINCKIQKTKYQQISNYKIQITDKLAVKTHEGMLIKSPGQDEGQNDGQSCNHAAMPSPQHPITPLPHTTLTTPPLTLLHSPIYRTGDLARWLADGNIEFLGRIDHQVKIRGFRIELGEIENQLLKHEGIKETVVVTGVDAKGDQYLCAYIVPGKELQTTGIREYLALALPDYMIPSFFMQLEKIPLTPNGKVDRKRLPAPHLTGGHEYTPPADGIEKKLVEIWAEVLGIEQEKISTTADFFQLGGHSLRATVITAIIHKQLNVKLPLAKIFKMSTIRKQANYIKKSPREIYQWIQPVEKKEYYGLASTQKRFYIAWQMDTASKAYNSPQIWIIEGEVDKEKLQQTFRRLLQRHEILRTSFREINEEPVQRIQGEVEFSIGYTRLAPPEPMAEIRAIRKFIQPFDLSSPPLLRVGLIKLPGSHILMMDIHHIVFDGVSTAILVREFMTLYGEQTPPPLKLQYKDYVRWQQRMTTSGEITRQETYWLEQFSDGIPELDFPVDYPRPLERIAEADLICFRADSRLTAAIKELAAKTETTPGILLMAAINVLLFTYTGQQDMIVGMGIAARTHADMGNMLGGMMNLIALRNRPAPGKTFRDFLQEVKRNSLKAYENQDYPFEDLVDKLGIKREAGRHPLFDVEFTFQNVTIEKLVIPGVKLTDYDGKLTDFMRKEGKFDLSFQAGADNETIEFKLGYLTALFKPSTAQLICRHLIEILEQVVRYPHTRLQDIKLSTKSKNAATTFSRGDYEEFDF